MLSQFSFSLFHLQLFPNERRIFSPSFSLPFPPTIKATSKEYKKCQCAIRIFELCMFDEKLLLRIIKLKVIWDIRACVCVRARVRCEFFQLCRVIKKNDDDDDYDDKKDIIRSVYSYIYMVHRFTQRKKNQLENKTWKTNKVMSIPSRNENATPTMNEFFLI